MSPLNVGTKFVFRIFSAVAALAVLAGFVFAPAAPAYADDGNAAGTGGKVLEKAYKYEQQWLAVQQERLSKTGELAAKVQAFIDAQKAKGKDTSALETALATYNQQIATAQGQHATAESILGAHVGFDADGHVTDRALAKQTVKDARQALADAHRTLQQAGQDLRAALKAYRNANKTK